MAILYFSFCQGKNKKESFNAASVFATEPKQK